MSRSFAGPVRFPNNAESAPSRSAGLQSHQSRSPASVRSIQLSHQQYHQTSLATPGLSTQSPLVWDFGHVPLYPAGGLTEPTRKITSPGDSDEQAADRLADQVLRTPELPPGLEAARLETPEQGYGRRASLPTIRCGLAPPGKPLDRLAATRAPLP